MVGTNKVFRRFCYILMVILALCCVLPFILLVMASITDETTLTVNGYSFFPAQLSFGAYTYLFRAAGRIIRSYLMTFLVTGLGTIINVTMTLFIGYLLSKEDLPFRNGISFFIFFTMLFSGGMVPSYIIWSQYFHVKDTIWGLICPNLLLGAYNIILMRTFFTANIPKEINEAAEMDSCSEVGKLVYIAIPLSKPMIATVSLFTALGYWNDWINGLYYLVKRSDLYTIQNVLNTMMNNVQFLKENTLSASESTITQIPTSGVRMAIAVIAALPILVVYPFFQKFFVKGIVVGGVKG